MRATAFRVVLMSTAVTAFCMLAALVTPSGVSANPQDNMQQGNLPDLVVSAAHAQIVQPCQNGGPLIVVSATIGNTGSAGSNVLDGGVTVREPNGPLSGSATLPQIAPGGSTTVSIALTAPGDPSQFAGNHQLTVAVNEQHALAESNYSNNTFGPVNVLIPANPCRSNQPANASPPATMRPVASAKPDFAIRTAAVHLEPFCHAGFPIATAFVDIANGGGTYRATDHRADFIIAQDSADPNYVGSMGLPSLDGGHSVRVSFPIFYTGKSLDAVAGTRQFRIAVNKSRTVDESTFANNTFGPLSLAIPANFCHPKIVFVRNNAMLYPAIPDLKKYAMNHRLSTPPPMHVMKGPGSADTGFLTLGEANPYTGPCPVTLHFTGHIDGAPGSSVTYDFARFNGGAWTYSGPVTATIPGGGSLAISSTLVVDSSKAGFQSYEVSITSPREATARPGARSISPSRAGRGQGPARHQAAWSTTSTRRRTCARPSIPPSAANTRRRSEVSSVLGQSRIPPKSCSCGIGPR